MIIVSICCFSYPLINLPLPGNVPLQFETPVDGYKVPAVHVLGGLSGDGSTEAEMKRPRWVN